MLEKANCDRCGKEFYREAYQLRRRKHHYCCFSCAFPPVITGKECLNCGELLTKKYQKKFCSSNCSATYSNKNRRIKSYCLICGILLPKKTMKYCSRGCFNISQKRGTITKFINGELTDGSVRSDTIRQYIIETQNGKCAICGCQPYHNNNPLVFIVDHIDGNITNNFPNNIRAICPNCNSQTDTFTGRNVGKNKITRWSKSA
jgi:predicted nucleic acid-binding Zn ribbon protein